MSCGECFPQTVPKTCGRSIEVEYDTPIKYKRKCFLENVTMCEFILFWIIFILLCICIIYCCLLLGGYNRFPQEYKSITDKKYRYVCKPKIRKQANYIRKTKFRNKYALPQKVEENALEIPLQYLPNALYDSRHKRSDYVNDSNSNMTFLKDMKFTFSMRSHMRKGQSLRQSLIELDPTYDNFICQGVIYSQNYIITTEACSINQTLVTLGDVFVDVDNVKSSADLDKTIKEDGKLPLVINLTNTNIKLLDLAVNIAEDDYVFLPPALYKLPNYGSIQLVHLSEMHRFRVIEVEIVHPYYCKLTYKKYNYTIDENLMICVWDPSLDVKPCSEDLLGSVLIKNKFLIGIYPIPNVKSCGSYDKPYVFNSVIPFVPWLRNNTITE